jgi:hypothetical protein
MDPGHHLIVIEDCEKRESWLTDWERGFLDSVRSQLEKDLSLSEKQVATLDRIWERVTEKG